MNFSSWVLWGFASTLLLTTVLAGSQELQLTRVNLPYVLGTIVTADRALAKVYGVMMHMLFGWAFSLIYVLIFEAWGRAGALRGGVLGAFHAAFVLMVGMPLLPGLHPRMASERSGPTAKRRLEPPGMFAMHYGVKTPIVILVSHILYGVVLGAFYRV